MQMLNDAGLSLTVNVIEGRRTLQINGPSCVKWEAIGEAYNPERVGDLARTIRRPRTGRIASFEVVMAEDSVWGGVIDRLLVLVGLVAVAPACSTCTSSATVNTPVVVMDSSRQPSSLATVSIDGRPCPYATNEFICAVTEAEGTFEIVALLNGRRASTTVELAANACGGRSKAYSGTVILTP